MRNLLQKMRRPAVYVAILGGFSVLSYAQTSSFPGFTSGNIVLTRSVYTGGPNTVAIGQALPPVCPATASCGKGKASDNGAGPSTTSTNNVWNNDKVDSNFGITSPIFIDQMTPTGTLVNTLPVPVNMMVTSFSSKSEMAINLSTDGTALTMMGYIAPVNTIDVSNSNTPAVYDPTNPAGGSYYRGVLQIGANGAMQVTPTNAYNGNNGRAAIMSNGLYYLVGNSNNGSGTPANVVAAGGVQLATPGQSEATPPLQVGAFSITSLTNPATGQPYAADKAGKDNNYRGLTIFNNTLYVTKGSGSNGVDTVYQVGNTGTLPTPTTAATASITILPGFPQAIARTAGANNIYPFGIWFANANTLYVADEGDGVAADAAGSQYAGLQKWILWGGQWQLAYVLQKGLNLGVQYSVPNYPTSLNPATAGLRNITGRVNGDGTVTIWGVTSTVSANGDQGADPNKLVMITDLIAYQTAAGAAFANEAFTTVRTANANEVLRGVALAPTSTTPMSNVPLILSAASPSVTAIAPGGLAFAYGQSLPSVDAGEIIGPFPAAWGGTSVSVTDAKGTTAAAPLSFVSPTQITFQIPSSAAAGSATVNITGPNGTQSASNIQIAPVAPALFTLNGSGLAAASAVSVSSTGTQTAVPVYSVASDGSFIASPINVANGAVYLTLYGTGLQAAGTAGVKATVNGTAAQVLFAGPSAYTGVDQVNILLPASLGGKGNVNILVTAGGIQASAAQVTIQ
jgi:uncharacterized protein (TIGR03437 family)